MPAQAVSIERTRALHQLRAHSCSAHRLTALVNQARCGQPSMTTLSPMARRLQENGMAIALLLLRLGNFKRSAQASSSSLRVKNPPACRIRSVTILRKHRHDLS
jgi:hypothetical protein